MRPKLTLNEVLALLKKECRRAGGQGVWSRRHGVSPSYVSDVLRKRYEPGTLILKSLGIERIVAYRKVRIDP